MIAQAQLLSSCLLARLCSSCKPASPPLSAAPSVRRTPRSTRNPSFSSEESCIALIIIDLLYSAASLSRSPLFTLNKTYSCSSTPALMRPFRAHRSLLDMCFGALSFYVFGYAILFLTPMKELQGQWLRLCACCTVPREQIRSCVRRTQKRGRGRKEPIHRCARAIKTLIDALISVPPLHVAS